MNFAITPQARFFAAFDVACFRSSIRTAFRVADGPISTKLISTADYRIQSAIDTRSANGLQLWQLYERK